MMKHYWHQVMTVTTWEFKRFFKWKQELASYGIMLAVMLGVSLWQGHIADGNKMIQIAVSEEIKLPENERFNISYFSKNELQAKNLLVVR